VKNAAVQLAGAYKTIVWNTGDLRPRLNEKSRDADMLFTWLENLPGVGGGLYLNGDDVADTYGWYSTQLRTKYCTFDLVAFDHAPTAGISPLGVGEPGGMFEDAFGVDTLVAFGGCPVINDFEILSASGTANLEMSYHGNGTTAGAIISDTTTNAVGNVVGVVLSGFSFHEIRDPRPLGAPVRREHMLRILEWLGNVCEYVLDSPGNTPKRNELAQNYPNPFNPITTIRYQVKTTGPVILKVYNVAGQLVRTLVDDVVDAGKVHEVTWKGLNDAGQDVASGVYFYRLVAGDYTQTRKMVMLK
jgi:hypothetical protein